MKFDASNKEHMAELVAALAVKGITPSGNKAACVQAKEALGEAGEVTSITDWVSANVAACASTAPPPLSASKPAHKKESTAAPAWSPSIVSGRVPQAYMALIHGDPKTGKTTVAMAAPGSLCIDLEDGSIFLDCARASIKDWESLVKAVDWFFTSDYNTAVIDTINRVEMFCSEYVCKKYSVTSIQEYDKKSYGKGTLEVISEVSKLLMKIRNSVVATGKNVIFIGHSDVKSCPNPEGENYERHTLGVHKDLVKFVCGIMDHLLFAHKKMTLQSADLDDKNSKLVAKGMNIYQLHTGGNPAIISGTRNPRLPQILQMPKLDASQDELVKFWKQFS